MTADTSVVGDAGETTEVATSSCRISGGHNEALIAAMGAQLDDVDDACSIGQHTCEHLVLIGHSLPSQP